MSGSLRATIKISEFLSGHQDHLFVILDSQIFTDILQVSFHCRRQAVASYQERMYLRSKGTTFLISPSSMFQLMLMSTVASTKSAEGFGYTLVRLFDWPERRLHSVCVKKRRPQAFPQDHSLSSHLFIPYQTPLILLQAHDEA